MFNSELQFISGEIANFCGESKKLGKYLGIVKRIGKQRAYQILSELKQREAEYLYKPPAERPPPIKDRAAYFIWKAKNG